jgi:membrane protein DedA with SNARE-associated domain
VEGLIDWLTSLPTNVLYAALGAIGAAENVFPPLPADTAVALGSWLAARGKGNALLAFLAPVIGNIAGASAMYYVGRTHGKEWMRRNFPKLANERSEQRLRDLYARYGVVALVLSRFIPGVRALVPPFAGAMHVPAYIAIGAMAVASTAWYGTISYVAFRAGADWSHLALLIRQSGLIAAAVAVGIACIAGVLWLIARRRSAGVES